MAQPVSQQRDELRSLAVVGKATVPPIVIGLLDAVLRARSEIPVDVPSLGARLAADQPWHPTLTSTRPEPGPSRGAL